MNKLKAVRGLVVTKDFCRVLLNILHRQQLHISAGYLSYVTLMSLVPLLVVMMSMMTAFPIFSEVKIIIENFVYINFVPASGEIVRQYITGFVDNASKMSAIAMAFLFLFALLLISAIDKTLNSLWQVKEKRRVFTSFSTYWMVLTLGPVLVGCSIAATSYIVSLISLDSYDFFGISHLFLRLLPLFASTVAFFLLYTVVPNKVITVKHALIGAFVAGLLFEIAKAAFAFYVTQLPSYETIYGALASVPILFLWVYLSWLVVLFGAVFTLALEEFLAEEKN
jgi:membrane protein